MFHTAHPFLFFFVFQQDSHVAVILFHPLHVLSYYLMVYGDKLEHVGMQFEIVRGACLIRLILFCSFLYFDKTDMLLLFVTSATCFIILSNGVDGRLYATLAAIFYLQKIAKSMKHLPTLTQMTL